MICTSCYRSTIPVCRHIILSFRWILIQLMKVSSVQRKRKLP
uniref:Uncharacterized protein n=1 Tax=Rhizophora mucronata TaxID=61149 RepID=A0A2P2PQN1_RHIMU